MATSENPQAGTAEAPDRLDPLRRLQVGDTTFIVDVERPIAALRDDRSGALRFVSWADAPQALVTMSASVLRAGSSVWVVYHPSDGTDLVHAPPGATVKPVVRLGVDGTVHWTDIGTATVIGAEDDVLWTTERRNTSGSSLANLHESYDIRLVDVVNGRSRTITFDRPITFVLQSVDGNGETDLDVLVQSEPPVREPSGWGSSSLRPRNATIRFPGSAELPGEVRFDELDPAQVTYPSDTELMQRFQSLMEEGPVVPDIDLTGIDGSRWPLVPLSAADIDATVEAAKTLFSSISAYWTNHRNGTVTPLAPGVSEGSVRSVGAWPHTELEVLFAQHDLTEAFGPEARMRRRVRLFDAAGRILVSQYADTHLMEDLITKMPPVSDTVDGILDI